MDDPWLDQTAASCPEYFSTDDCGVVGSKGTVKGVGRYLLSTVVYLLTAWRNKTLDCITCPKDIVDRLCIAYPRLSRKNISDHVQFVTSSCAASAAAATSSPPAAADTATAAKSKVNNDSAISFHYGVLNKYMGNRIAEVINAIIVRPERSTRHPYICGGGNDDLLPIEAKNWYVYSHAHLERVIDHVFRTCGSSNSSSGGSSSSSNGDAAIVVTGEYSNEFCSVHVKDDQYVTYNVHTQLQLKRMLRMMTPKWWWGGADEKIVGVYVDYTYANSAYGHRNNYQYVPPATGATTATDINFDSTSKVVYEVIVNGKDRVLITDRLVDSKLLQDVLVNEWFVFPTQQLQQQQQNQRQQQQQQQQQICSSGARKRRKMKRDILDILLSDDDDTREEDDDDEEEEDDDDDEAESGEEQRIQSSSSGEQQQQQQHHEQSSVWSRVCSALEAVTLSYVPLGDDERPPPELRLLATNGSEVSSHSAAATVVAMLDQHSCVVATADKRTLDCNRDSSSSASPPSAAESFVTVCICTRSFYCDRKRLYVNMVLNSVSPHCIYRKKFDTNIVTTYSRRARIVWFNHVASCSPIVLVDYANSGNVYYFYKTSAPYLHTFVTYIIPNAHRDLLRCSSNCTCCPHRELVVDVGHTFLDFFTLVVVHASVIHQRTKSNGSGGTTKRQRIDFVLWEGKCMECNDEFKASFERSICLPMTCPPDQSHTTVILDMNDPGRMLFDRRIRYSVDTRPPSTSTSTNGAPAAATTTTTPAWWTSTRSLLGGRFTPSEMVAIGKVFTTERVGGCKRSYDGTRAVVYAYMSTHHSTHVFEAVTVTYLTDAPTRRCYSSYRDLVSDRMGWAASMHRPPTNEWTRRDMLRIVTDTACVLSDGIDLNAPIQSVTPVTFETLAYLKILTKERPITVGERACTTGLHAFVKHHYEKNMDARRVDGLAQVLARRATSGRIGPSSGSQRDQWCCRDTGRVERRSQRGQNSSVAQNQGQDRR
ncbi:hypothetical protein V5799_017109 [Amblyomma americanum]|uniref:Uncharacterized protein n=1 Tax=Amblyomma americanum TaxID=6943 RepID=A0AAQ4F3B9_AMBAM